MRNKLSWMETEHMAPTNTAALTKQRPLHCRVIAAWSLELVLEIALLVATSLEQTKKPQESHCLLHKMRVVELKPASLDPATV